MSKKYQPSNGTEGVLFTDKFCFQCKHCDPNPEGGVQCDILANTMCYSVDDPEYPSEWIYGEDGQPTCTKWSKWDWGLMGPPEEEIINPNQLKLF